jgi:hypothetical protein
MMLYCVTKILLIDILIFFRRTIMFKKMIYLISVILILASGNLTQAGNSEWEAAISSDNPLHWYKFNETIGSDCIDSGSAGLNGTYDGVSLAQEGFFGAGTAVGFERSGANRANFENATDMPGPWTVEYIVKTTKPPAANDPQALHDSDATSIRLAGWTADGEAGFTLYGVADYRFTPEGDLTLVDLVIQPDEWMHLVWRNVGNSTQLFFNGQLVGTSPDSIDLPRLRIGGRGGGPADHLNGVLDEAVVFDRALSDADIIAHASAADLVEVKAHEPEPIDGALPDLLGWWTCDEGAGTIVGDASGNGRDGIFVEGDPAWGSGIRGSAAVLVGPTLIEIPPLNLELKEATMAGWIKPNGSQPDWSSFIMTRDPALATGFNVLGFQLAYHWNDTGSSWSFRGGDMIAEDDWTFAAVTIESDKATFYVNGVAGSVNEIPHGPCDWNSNIYLGGDGTAGWVSRRMNGALDDVSLFSRALTADEILEIMQGFEDYPTASSPTPANGAHHANSWVTLSWWPGIFAVSHDIYFGDNFDDVNDGVGGTFQGNQIAPSFNVGLPGGPYPNGLVLDTTYYWRIDDVEADGSTVHRGDVWSFTISVVEDFETTDFSKFPWSSSGEQSWETTRSERHSGFFSAKSGSIEDFESTTLQVSIDCVLGDITFYCKVSSEPRHDNLKFKIDGVEKGTWSGEEDWSEVSFPVDEGTRTFEWTYSKDGSDSEGDDTAWIDDIVFPIGL